jgi:serine/threonine-protein kinase
MAQRVAVKLLRSEARLGADVVERFAREARAASRLRGEHVVRILDVDDSDAGEPFLVMEYLEGTDLHARLSAADAGAAIEDAVGWVIQACEGMAEAHALGIVHRDLKPANLFLTRRPDGSEVVKILDFGISKIVEAETKSELAITRPQVAIGSPSYMSPEQLKNAASVDARADIWALGVVLYELLTNRLPFEATSTAALAACIASEPPRPLCDARPEVPEELERVVARCLEKDPAKRFADVAELAHALAPFAPGAQSAALRAARVTEQHAQRQRTTDPAALRRAEPLAKARATASIHDEAPRNPLRAALETEYGSTVGKDAPAQVRRPIARWWFAAAAIALLGGTGLFVASPRAPVSTGNAPTIAPPPKAEPPAATDDTPVPAAPAVVDAGVTPKPRVAPPARPPKNPMEIDFR